MTDCDHEWETDTSELNFGVLGETIEFPTQCAKCGATGTEVWIFSCYIKD